MRQEASPGSVQGEDFGLSNLEALQQVVEDLPEAILLLDREWRITYANATARQVSRIRPQHLNCQTMWEMYPEIVGTDLERAYREVAADGKPRQVDAFYYEPFDAWFTLRIVPTQSGVAAHYCDVTAARSAEASSAALRASDERYRVLTELNPQALWSADAQGKLVYANQRFLEYIGKGRVPQDGSEYLQCFYEGDRERVLQVWSRSVATGEDYIVDARLLRAHDKAARWWQLRALPIRDESGAIQQWLGMATDIHESRLAADRLRAQYAEIEWQRRELEAIYRGSPIGLALFEPKQLRLVRINDRQCDILGMPAEAALGKSVEELSPALTAAHHIVRRAAHGEQMLNVEVEGELPARPGEHRYWNVSYSPIFAEDGSVHAIACATIEVTQQKRAELALLQAEKLAAVGRMASSIAHEINNPLESVVNLIYLARKYAILPEVHDLLQTADQELRRVSMIATQTLRFHRQSTKPQAVRCSDLFATVLSIFEGRLRNSQIVVEQRLSDRPIVCFEADIRQVLANLIGNAIDAMPSGGRLLLRGREAVDYRTSRPGFLLTVADTGSGMDAATRARIFEAFFTTKGFAGTGLGLWISAEIVQRHQGRLRARSSQQEGHRGTVISLFLPVAALP